MDDGQQHTADSFLQDLASALSERLPTAEGLRSFADSFVAAYTEQRTEQHDDDFLFNIIKPTAILLIRFKDDMAKELRQLNDYIAEKGCANEGTDYAVDILGNALSRIDDILLGYDVQPYRCGDEKFNPRRQNVVKKIAAENPELAKTVAESLSDGYERKGIIVSKERVAAYVAKSNAEGEA